MRLWAAILLAAGLAGAGARAGTPALWYENVPAKSGLDYHPAALAGHQRPLVLALGGGGAKGIAHAGVLQRLQEEGIPVAGIAGTSAGAFVGGLYAAGYSGSTIQTLLEHYDLGSLMLDRDLRFPGETFREQEDDEVTWLRFLRDPHTGFASSPGAWSGQNLKLALRILLARRSQEAWGSFDHLRVPFRAVTTDLQTGHAFAPDRGDLASAVCASMSVPGILSPVFWDGDQLVDGMLVQNLPVETARSLDPQAAVLAVEVGQGLESAYRTSLLGLAFRALDVSIENRTEISRRAADLVLKPNTKAITYLEFHRQVQAAVQEGRAAFDRNLDALEDLLYGPEAALPAPGGVPVVRGPAPLRARAMELAAATLPDGARLNRHYLRWMRRILAEGSARRVDLEFTEAGPVLTLEPYPMLRRVEVTGPEAWTGLCGNLLEDFQVQAGAAYNPVSLGRCLDTLVLRSSLMGRPWLKVERTSFDPDQGVLQVHLREVWPQHFQVQGDRLPETQTAGLHKLLQPLEGRPMDAKTTAESFTLAEKRLGLEELRVAPDPSDPSGSTLRVTPVPDQRIALEGHLAYESTREIHGVLGLHQDHVLGTDCRFGIRGSMDRLQDEVVLEGSRVSALWPRLSCGVSAAQTVYRFLPESLWTPYAVAPFQPSLVHRFLQERILTFDVSTRLGREDQGVASLVCSRAWNSLHPQAEGEDLPASTQIQATGEWDDLDRCLFPTRGTLVRAKAGLGWLDHPDFWSGTTTFRSAYAQVTHFWPLGARVSLEGDGEAGLGWHLPFSQWYSAGGPSFLAGTPSGAFRAPNFAMARVGLPILALQAFGANIQVVPRFDVGRLAVAEPGQLTASPQVRGLSLGLRSQAWKWFCELDGGRWFTSAAVVKQEFRVNLLVGTHPFSLWRNP